MSFTLPSKCQAFGPGATEVGVVMAAAGYPGAIRKNDPIHGLDTAPGDQAKVFHAGTTLRNGQVLTSGGRVLCVCGLGANVGAARDAAYAALSGIGWEGAHFRSDIGYRAISREEHST